MVLMVLVTIGLFSCAPPEEPAGLEKGSAAGPSTKNDGKAKRNSEQGPFNFGGAPVGDNTTKSAVKECVDKGFFYERRADKTVGCTTMKLAKINCTEDGVKVAMNSVTRPIWTAKMAMDVSSGGLKGFQIDQCLDCPTWDANSTCAEFGAAGKGNEQKKSGFIIHLIKQDGTGLTPRRVFSPKP